MKDGKMIKVYATTEGGNGYCSVVSEVESLEDLHLHVGVFDKNVVLTFEEVVEAKDSED
jgi:hypothetical protein